MQLLARSSYMCLKISSQKAFCFAAHFLNIWYRNANLPSLINSTYRNLPFTHIIAVIVASLTRENWKQYKGLSGEIS